MLWKIEETNKFGGARPQARPATSLTSKSASPHLGNVTVLMYASLPSIIPGGRGYLFTGSADRTIKIWTIWKALERAGSDTEPCQQTLAGHGSTITTLQTTDTLLISSSSDKTIRLWSPESQRGLMLNPFYVCIKVSGIEEPIASTGDQRSESQRS